MCPFFILEKYLFEINEWFNKVSLYFVMYLRLCPNPKLFSICAIKNIGNLKTRDLQPQI